MVWAGVKEVGFGYALGPGKISGREGTLIYVVAKYSPTPNTIGKFTENIRPPRDRPVLPSVLNNQKGPNKTANNSTQP